MNIARFWPFGRTALIQGGAVLLLLMLFALGYLWQHTLVVETGYRIEAARAELARLEHQRAALTLKLEGLASLPRVDRLAREQMGMAPVHPEQLVRVYGAPVDGTPPQPGTGGVVMLAAAMH